MRRHRLFFGFGKGAEALFSGLASAVAVIGGLAAIIHFKNKEKKASLMQKFPQKLKFSDRVSAMEIRDWGCCDKGSLLLRIAHAIVLVMYIIPTIFFPLLFFIEAFNVRGFALFQLISSLFIFVLCMPFVLAPIGLIIYWFYNPYRFLACINMLLPAFIIFVVFYSFVENSF